MSWTDERVELLKKLYLDGLSCSRIAAELGGMTRNAVIGKIHRLGLSGRVKTASPSSPRQRPLRSIPWQPKKITMAARAAAAALELKSEPLPERPMDVIPIAQRCTFADLTPDTCRWPFGHPNAGEFYFCGAMSIEGLPYCAYHSRIAYQPPSSRRR